MDCFYRNGIMAFLQTDSEGHPLGQAFMQAPQSIHSDGFVS